jgi:hypothetical protein
MLGSRAFAVHEGVVAATSLANSTEILFSQWAGAQVYVPTGASATSLTWYSAPVSGGAFLPVQDGAGVAVTSTISGGMCCLIPAACFGCGVLKAVANAEVSLKIHFKG